MVNEPSVFEPLKFYCISFYCRVKDICKNNQILESHWLPVASRSVYFHPVILASCYGSHSQFKNGRIFTTFANIFLKVRKQEDHSGPVSLP